MLINRYKNSLNPFRYASSSLIYFVIILLLFIVMYSFSTYSESLNLSSKRFMDEQHHRRHNQHTLSSSKDNEQRILDILRPSTIKPDNHHHNRHVLLSTSSFRYKFTDQYSTWPKFIDLNNFNAIKSLNSDLNKEFVDNCLAGNVDLLSIEKLERALSEWREASKLDEKCKSSYHLVNKLYEISFKENRIVSFTNQFSGKVKSYLNNSDELFNRVFNQKLIQVRNKYTLEENVYNPLRTKKPVKISNISSQSL